MNTIYGTRLAILPAALTLALLGGCACNQEAAPVAQPAPVAAAPQTVKESFALSAEGLFDFDKATLRAEHSQQLDDAVEKYRGNARLRSLAVVGHTDSTGDDNYNQKLSEDRANAVRDYLVEKGVDGSKITASGMGESSPVASNDSESGRQKNRRVELSAELEREVTR